MSIHTFSVMTPSGVHLNQWYFEEYRTAVAARDLAIAKGYKVSHITPDFITDLDEFKTWLDTMEQQA